MSNKNDYRKNLHQLAEEFGWSIKKARNNHFVLTLPGRKQVIASHSPKNSRRTLLNVRAMLKRCNEDRL